jgi:acetyltransferase-like isoleucine patch superfamily enzyme
VYSILRKWYRGVTRFFFTTRVRLSAKSVGPGLKVNGLSRVSATTELGANVNFNGMVITGKGKVVIGDNFHSGFDCLMITDVHNYDHGAAIPYDDTYRIKDITIADNVWLGSRVLVLGGVTLGEGCIIQAGAVVVGDIPRCAIAGGNPARPFKMRDIEHYERLKALGRFH